MANIPIPFSNGAIKRVAGTDPAAGVELLDTVPAGKYWMLLCVSVSLVQGLTQTPFPFLVIDDGTNVIFSGPGTSASQAVSTTTRYNWAPGLPLLGQIGATSNVRSAGPLPDGLVLPPGFRIGTQTIGIGANSDYGAPSYMVCELG